MYIEFPDQAAPLPIKVLDRWVAAFWAALFFVSHNVWGLGTVQYDYSVLAFRPPRALPDPYTLRD